MKKVLITLLILTIAFASFACATPYDDYNNFLLDLDIVTRLDICFSKIADGATGVYIHAELLALIDDLATWQGDYQTAGDTNKLLTQCARSLIAAMDHTASDDADEAEAAYILAEDYYKSALALINKASTENSH